MAFAVELAALDFVNEIQVFVDGHVDVERGLFRKEADQLLRFVRVFENVDAADLRFARGGRQIAGEDVHRGRLARAVRSEEAHDLALADLEADVVNGELGAIVFYQIVYFNHTDTHFLRFLVYRMYFFAFSRLYHRIINKS